MTHLSTPAFKSMGIAFLISFIFVNTVISQQSLTKVNGMNAYLHLPDDYNSGSKSYPVIVFVTGYGNVGTDPSGLMEYGPAHFINKGHNMQFLVNGTIEKPIVISLQPASGWPSPAYLQACFDEIMNRWRIDENRFYLTGYSMGGWAHNTYITESEAYAKRPAAIVAMSGPKPDNPIENLRWYAAAGGKWWGFEGRSDIRGNKGVADMLNSYKGGSAKYTLYDGDHCCWNTFYDPAWTENGESIYTWMLKQRIGGGGAPGNAAPSVNAGADLTIRLPTNTVTLRGSGSDPDGSISSFDWKKMSGPADYTLVSAHSAETSVNNLIAGTYDFHLTAIDNAGAAATDIVRVNVLAESQQSGSGRILIDLGQNTNTTDRWGKYWNNVNNVSGGIALQNAVNVNNQPSSVGLDVINRIDGSYDPDGPGINPNNTIGEIGDYHASAVNDNAYAHISGANGRWRLFGLDPARTYRIKFWGTRSASGIRTIQIRRASGDAAWQEYNGINNKDYEQAAVFENITGQSEAIFDIRVRSGETFGYISLIDISYTDPVQGQSAQTSVERGGISTTEALGSMQEGNDGTKVFKVYPNPAVADLNVQFSHSLSGPVNIQVFNQGGVLLKSYKYDKNTFGISQRLSLEGVPKGMYVLQLTIGGYSTVQRFVKL